MEARMKKYRQVSPERAKVWKERSPKYQQNRKVPVVYYLCRNRQLEHPHFIEVPLSSPDALYLKDVIGRLNVMRGRGMASMYSWSCKRSYKNGFVWHDLSNDDLILPAHGNEYVLKGSELFDESNSDRLAPVVAMKMQNLKQLPEPASSRCQDDASSSSSMNGKDTKNSPEDEISPSLQRPGSSDVSPEYRDGKHSSWNGPLSLTEYKVYKSDGLADASTQTEENVSRPKTREICTRGVSTDDGFSEHECNDNYHVPRVKENSEISENSVSPPPSSSSASSSGGKTETLESLIRADVNKIKSFRILEKEEIRIPTNASLNKASNMLMQLISCGSISVKDHSFGLIPTYRPRFSHSKFASPFFSTSLMLGELDCLSDNPRLMGLRLEDKEYFSGSLVETKMLKDEGDGINTLKRSSSYNADRTCKQLDSTEENDESTSGRSKCIPRSIKASISKQPKSESMRSPVADKLRSSSNGPDGSEAPHSCTSNGSSGRITEPVSGKKQSKKLDSFREEKEKVFKIEERLPSGARVIIQSEAPCDSSVRSS